jgi:hypothetical protein
MRWFSILAYGVFIFMLSLAPAAAGVNNNTPQDTFASYQIALRDERTDLLAQVYYFPDAGRMTDTRMLKELKELRYYDGYKSYSIIQVLDEGDSAKLKAKGTLRGREGVRRTYQMKRFNTGWMIVKVWNS